MDNLLILFIKVFQCINIVDIYASHNGKVDGS